jgi:hypothetical protein
MLAKLGTGVFVAYRISTGRAFTLRGMIGYALAIAGVMAAFDGFTLASREETRARYGHVVPGVIVRKLSSTGADGSQPIGRRGGRNQAVRRPVVTIDGFQTHDILARFIVTGSPLAWVIEYRFPCDAPRGCMERDFVSEQQWADLREGQPVNVRRGEGERLTARLDDNPQWPIAAADAGVGAALLLIAAALFGRLGFKGHQWVSAPAVVLAVEPVPDDEGPRWRVRFAYFDREGVPQESADEVGRDAWKVGDSCVAVFQPTRPDLATLRPAPALS